MKQLQIHYDGRDGVDVVTIEGMKYSADLFRQLGGLMPSGQAFRLVRREEDGTIWLEKIEEG